MIVLVRHADAGDKHRWAGADELRPLSPKGRRQAGGSVADLLTGLAVTRLLTSPALRCVQTLEHAADRLRLPIEPREELGVHADVERLLRLLEEPESDGSALCTHGETLTALSRAWAPSARVAFDGPAAAHGLAHTPKGAAWIIDGYHGPAARARYVASHASTGS